MPAQIDQPTYYRLARHLVARLVGLGVIVLAVLVFGATAVVAIAGLSAGPAADIVVIVGAVGAVLLLAAAWWLSARAYVVRAGLDSYRIGLLRGAGLREARWNEVEDAVTATLGGVPCVVLRLKAGATTTIPVGVLATDREQFVRELQQHLQRGHRLRQV